MNEKKLTDKEREFATRWHGVIYAFLNENKLPEAEYYDIAALGYLRAVMRYHRESKLKKYSFSTIAWQAMRSSVGNKQKSDRIRDAFIAYSLNELTEEGTEYGEFIQDTKDSFAELAQQEDMQELMRQIMPALTDRQRSHLTAKLEGYKAQEIMKQQRKSVQDYHKDLGEIKETVLSVVSCSVFGGVFRKWIGRIFGRISKVAAVDTRCALPAIFAGYTQVVRQDL